MEPSHLLFVAACAFEAIQATDEMVARLDQFAHDFPHIEPPDREPLLIVRCECMRLHRLACLDAPDWRDLERMAELSELIRRLHQYAIWDFHGWAIQHGLCVTDILPPELLQD